jgi:hypothetical protein
MPSLWLARSEAIHQRKIFWLVEMSESRLRTDVA